MESYRIRQLEKKAFYIEEYRTIINSKCIVGFWKNKYVDTKVERWCSFDLIKYETLDEALEAVSEIGKYPIIHKVK